MVALGGRALPFLERELRLGIRFKELNQILGTGGSRRWAVAQVLARMPGDRSTDPLVRSLSDTPDNHAMMVGTLMALRERNLADEQVLAMLVNHWPQVALAALAHAAVLDMALARLGDRSRVPRAAKCLTDFPSHTIGFCAAMTLWKLRDPSAIPAFRKALRDPYHRQDGSCVKIGDGEVYPVRIVAADALIELGDDPKRVRETMRRKE